MRKGPSRRLHHRYNHQSHNHRIGILQKYLNISLHNFWLTCNSEKSNNSRKLHCFSKVLYLTSDKFVQIVACSIFEFSETVTKIVLQILC